MSLDGQHVVIIGGSSGIGLATAHAAVAAGASVTIASANKSRLEAALAELPDTCAGMVADARSEEDLAALFAQVGEFDHLVYTAGDAIDRRPLADRTMDEARRGFEVRFWGAVTAVKHATPHFRPGASIVLTSGTITVRPAPGAALSAAGTAATEGLTRGLAVELAPVRVNAVRAGVIRTPLWDRLPPSQREETFAALTGRTLTKSVGEAEQIAATNLYLMQNGFVTGVVLTVDGGSVLT